MKSAFELAMERLQADDPDGAKPLSDAQKAALQEIEVKARAKIAEREVFLAKQLKDAKAERDGEAVQQIEKQLRNERARLEDDMERAKEKVRQGA